MKIALYILIILTLLSCSDYKSRKSDKSQINDSLFIRKDIAFDTVKKEYESFEIEEFHRCSDSLLKKLKGTQYGFDIISDTFHHSSNNIESFTQGHGLFWDLYEDSIDMVVRHCLFEPNSKKMLRIYLIEAFFYNKSHLKSKMAEFKTFIKDSTPDGLDSYNFRKNRLTPLHDYIMTGNKKLYWINAGYPYQKSEFYQFMECLNENIDTSLFKGEILCLLGSDCKILNVP